MITIVDYGMGNLRSVQKGFEKVGVVASITDRPEDVARAEKLVLPGVGAFQDAMDGLASRNLIQPIVESIEAGTPFLGICLGMQLLFSVSYEDGEHKGLDLIPGEVIRFSGTEDSTGQRLKIPHMGWNELSLEQSGPLLKGVSDHSYMYFVHSYYVSPADPSVIAATTTHGEKFCSMVATENIAATQFHPEKSQERGLRILENFSEL